MFTGHHVYNKCVFSQLGLLVDYEPDGMMDVNENEADLEAELAMITGQKPAGRGNTKGKGMIRNLPLFPPS